MTELEERTVGVDLDFTLCRHDGDYAEARPLEGAREALVRLREAGWHVVIHTGRHFNQWKTTVDWLARENMPYDQIVFGKPPCRYYVDDRAIAFEGDWSRVLARIGTPSAGGAAGAVEPEG